VSYKKQELITLRGHLGVTPVPVFVFGGICVAHLFSFLCGVFYFSRLRSASKFRRVNLIMIHVHFFDNMTYGFQ